MISATVLGALMAAAPAFAQSPGMFKQTTGGKPMNAPAQTVPPPALPGATSGGRGAAPPTRAAGDMEPTEALFDAINRGDITAARDSVSRGADLNGRNILGMTPIELSVDLARNDISFMLLSMRGDDGRGRPTANETAAKPAPTRQARQVPAAPGPPRSPYRSRRRRRPPACSAATAARRTRMPDSWGSTPAGDDGRNFIPLTCPRLAHRAAGTHMPILDVADRRTAMNKQDIRRDAHGTATSMIRLHGLRAQAVALERAAELRQQGDVAGFDLWQQVHAAICELRRTAPAMERA
ncbi:MAG: hypothetical protein WDN25_21405 [Acetobacteraceae bacterium]